MNSRRIHFVLMVVAALLLINILRMSDKPKHEDQVPAKSKSHVVTSEAYAEKFSVRQEKPAAIPVEPGQFTIERNPDLR